MTMRFPASFILSKECVVTDLASSAMGHRQRVEFGDLPEPEVPMRQLGVRDGERGGAHDANAELYDVEVQRARPPAHARLPCPVPPPVALDRPALPQQASGVERGL